MPGAAVLVDRCESVSSVGLGGWVRGTCGYACPVGVFVYSRTRDGEAATETGCDKDREGRTRRRSLVAKHVTRHCE